jgi:hypothetical protein
MYSTSSSTKQQHKLRPVQVLLLLPLLLTQVTTCSSCMPFRLRQQQSKHGACSFGCSSKLNSCAVKTSIRFCTSKHSRLVEHRRPMPQLQEGLQLQLRQCLQLQALAHYSLTMHQL